mmetsp:Transcript_9175/g.22500  ORF Transcript_9175/g.22500 Transcript_9175/m.22500 type:complete len:206 (+) Transcript_9175:690-1307(+)
MFCSVCSRIRASGLSVRITRLFGNRAAPSPLIPVPAPSSRMCLSEYRRAFSSKYFANTIPASHTRRPVSPPSVGAKDLRCNGRSTPSNPETVKSPSNRIAMAINLSGSVFEYTIRLFSTTFCSDDVLMSPTKACCSCVLVSWVLVSSAVEFNFELDFIAGATTAGAGSSWGATGAAGVRESRGGLRVLPSWGTTTPEAGAQPPDS